jgi:hypothetical protein
MPDNFDFEDIKFLDGELLAEIIDEDGTPNKVIEKGTPAKVKVDWWLKTNDPWILDGTKWLLEVYAESIGPGGEPLVAKVEVPIGPGPFPEPHKIEWHEQVLIDTNIPEDGACKMVLLLTHRAQFVDGSWRKTRLAGFVEIPMVQFYTHET